jgi:hypothetical protein
VTVKVMLVPVKAVRLISKQFIAARGTWYTPPLVAVTLVAVVVGEARALIGPA